MSANVQPKSCKEILEDYQKILDEEKAKRALEESMKPKVQKPKRIKTRKPKVNLNVENIDDGFNLVRTKDRIFAPTDNFLNTDF